MKNVFPHRRTIRLGSLAFVSAGIVAELVLAGTSPSPLPIFDTIFSGTAALICCSLPHETGVNHLVCSGSILVISIILRLIHPASLLYVFIVSGCAIVSYLIFILEKYGQAGFFLSNIAVWHGIETSERSIMVIALLAEAILYFAIPSSTAVSQWLVTALSAAGFVLLYLYMYFEWYILVGSSVRAEIRRNLRGRVQPVAPVHNDEEKKRMESLYRRITDLMEDKQPYLDPDLSEIKMASMVFSNQNYLSRTVNTMSNLNFKQFLNSYRVQYAVELMKKDPRMQVKEIASLSGFNSTPSFNMAFKLFKGMTPGKYMKEMYQQDDDEATDHEPQPSLQGMAL